MKTCTYLGVRFSENGRIESKLERRIDRAATVVGAVRRTVFGNRELSREAKMTVYKCSGSTNPGVWM